MSVLVPLPLGVFVIYSNERETDLQQPAAFHEALASNALLAAEGQGNDLWSSALFGLDGCGFNGGACMAWAI